LVAEEGAGFGVDNVRVGTVVPEPVPLLRSAPLSDPAEVNFTEIVPG
jgi:hypothetical protein